MKRSAWIIEEDAGAREQIRRQMELNDFAPRCFARAESALEAMDGAMPEVIVVDLMLPSMSAVDMVRRVREREHWQHVPIVIVSMLEKKETRVVGFGGVGRGRKNETRPPLVNKIQEILACVE